MRKRQRRRGVCCSGGAVVEMGIEDMRIDPVAEEEGGGGGHCSG